MTQRAERDESNQTSGKTQLHNLDIRSHLIARTDARGIKYTLSHDFGILRGFHSAGYHTRGILCVLFHGHRFLLYDSFKRHLDKFWKEQKLQCNHTAEIQLEWWMIQPFTTHNGPQGELDIVVVDKWEWLHGAAHRGLPQDLHAGSHLWTYWLMEMSITAHCEWSFKTGIHTALGLPLIMYLRWFIIEGKFLKTNLSLLLKGQLVSVNFISLVTFCVGLWRRGHK